MAQTTYSSDDPYIALQIADALQAAIGAVNHYQSTFQSGQVAVAGPNGTLVGNDNLTFGLALPNATGIPGPSLLMGSGGGNGTPVTFNILQDVAFDNVTPGNTLIINSGSTASAGLAAGGLLWLIGGAAFGGLGGQLLMQGGTSVDGTGGNAVLQGGNSTSGQPGDAVISGGQNGKTGGNVHLIMTSLNGFAGVVRIRVNSTPLWDFFNDGSLFNYLNPRGPSFGLLGQPMLSGGPGKPCSWGSPTSTPLFTGVIRTAGVDGGADGTMTFSSGILTAQTGQVIL